MSNTPRKEPAQRAYSGGIGHYSLIALLLGIIIIVIALTLGHWGEPLRTIVADILKEFGIVLVSIFGISYLYEKLSADQHFAKFVRDLEIIMRQGESNAAMCEALGIIEIHDGRDSFREKHALAKEAAGYGKGDRLRLTGRSLIHALNEWGQFETMLTNGATLQLCMCDPTLPYEPLRYLSRYLTEDSQNAISHFALGLRQWLIKNTPPGQVELRFHQVHLLDSLVEMDHGDVHRIAWDLNFGEGIESRHIFFIDTGRSLGENLSVKRYQLIWDHAVSVFFYSNGTIQTETLDFDARNSFPYVAK